MNANNIKRLRYFPAAFRLLMALQCLLVMLVISQSVGCKPKLSETPSPTAESGAAGANDTIESADPTVDFDSIAKATRDSDGNIVQLDFRGREVSDDMISAASKLSTLKVLKLSGKDSEVTPTAKSLQQIGKLKNLKVLALDFLPVDDETVRAFAGLGQLKELLLAGTQLTDDSAETVAALKSLTKLRLARTKITNATLAKLATLPSIADLDASECEGIDDDGAASIGKWGKLTKLNLFGTSVGNELTAEISGLKSLRSLNLDRTKVTDDGLASIGKLTDLTFLHLGSTQISDAGLDALKDLDKLEKLIVTRTNVTQDGVDSLTPELPNTEIQLEYVPGK